MSNEVPKSDGQSAIRGLGCGSKPMPAGKINKLCVDCGEKSLVEADLILCPICDGPLSSSYDD